MRSSARGQSRSRTLAVAAAALSLSAGLGACGGSGPRSGGTSSPYGPKNSPAAVSRCMRANGVSGFPDPRSGPNGGGVGFPGGLLVTSTGSMVVMGIPFSGPALIHAEKVCKEYLPPSGGPPPASASQRRQALEQAECMRRHGVPNFPDPTFSGGQINPDLGNVNPDSPAFKHAAAVCGGGANFQGVTEGP